MSTRLRSHVKHGRLSFLPCRHTRTHPLSVANVGSGRGTVFGPEGRRSAWNVCQSAALPDPTVEPFPAESATPTIDSSEESAASGLASARIGRCAGGVAASWPNNVDNSAGDNEAGAATDGSEGCVMWDSAEWSATGGPDPDWVWRTGGETVPGVSEPNVTPAAACTWRPAGSWLSAAAASLPRSDGSSGRCWCWQNQLTSTRVSAI